MAGTLFGLAQMTATGSALLWTAPAGYRWKLLKGQISVTGTSASASCALCEGTVDFYSCSPRGSADTIYFDFSPEGWRATATNSAFKIKGIGTMSTCYAIFIGTTE